MNNVPIRLASLGLADHGKSSLLGYIAYQYIDKERYNREMSNLRSNQWFQDNRFFTYMFDRTRDEREGVYCGYSSTKKKFVGASRNTSHLSVKINGKPFWLIDSPGHYQMLNNTFPGIYQANSAVYVINAGAIDTVLDAIDKMNRKELIRERGPHLTPLYPLFIRTYGLKSVAIVLSKMDTVNYSQEHYLSAKNKILPWFLKHSHLPNEKVTLIPVSIDIAHQSDVNIFKRPRPLGAMGWYEGDRLIDWINSLAPIMPNKGKTLMPIESVYLKKIDNAPLVVTGHLMRGTLSLGQNVKIAPVEGGDGKSKISITARIKSIKRRDSSKLIPWHTKQLEDDGNNKSFEAGHLVGINLTLDYSSEWAKNSSVLYRKGCIIVSEDQKLLFGRLVEVELFVPDGNKSMELLQTWKVYVYGKAFGESIVLNKQVKYSTENIYDTEELQGSILRVKLFLVNSLAYPIDEDKKFIGPTDFIISNDVHFFGGSIINIIDTKSLSMVALNRAICLDEDDLSKLIENMKDRSSYNYDKSRLQLTIISPTYEDVKRVGKVLQRCTNDPECISFTFISND